MKTFVRRASTPRLWLRIADGMAVMMILVTACLSLHASWSRPHPQPLRPIAPGMTSESRQDTVGLVQLVTVDLRRSSVSVELAPVVDDADNFRLVWLPTLTKQSAWDVAISGGAFSTLWGKYAPAGNLGRPEQTLICEGRTLHRGTGEALLWFDEHQTGHLEIVTENSAAWTAARWGLGGRTLCVVDGHAVESSLADKDQPDRRTVVGLDRTGCTLTLATFESAKASQAAEWFAAQGIWRAMELGTAENAGIVIDTPLVDSTGTLTGPKRFITHALGIRSSRTRETGMLPMRQRSVGR